MPNPMMRRSVLLARRPSPAEFEMAYQARVAMDRIRFAIKATEMAGSILTRLRRRECNSSTRWIGLKRRSIDSRTDGEAQTIPSHEVPILGRDTLRTGPPELFLEVYMLNLSTESDVAERLQVRLASVRRWRF
jgi:hypothetical protein